MNRSKTLVIALALSVASASQAAFIFSNININSAPLSTGSSSLVIGNSISFMTPNAIVGDTAGTPAGSLRGGILQIQYDVEVTGSMAAIVTANVNLGAAVLGANSSVFFIEQAFKLDANGNEVGGNIGSVSHNFTATSNPSWSGAINLTMPANKLRLKKTLILAAPDTGANNLDLAAVAVNNQSIIPVPEPTGIAAMALGAAMILRRRSK
jgi:hypothetical protein